MELDDYIITTLPKSEILLASCDRYFWVSCGEYWRAFDDFGDLKEKLPIPPDQEKS